jgi:hypothetical protein
MSMTSPMSILETSHFDGQCAGIFHGVEEDRRNLAAQTEPPARLFGT